MQMVLTRMRSFAYSLASDLVRLIPAARDTLVGKPSARGALPPTVVTLMMRPPPRCFMCGITSRHIRTAPITLRSKSACQASSPTFSNGAAAEVPALLRRMSTPPNCRTVAFTTASQSAGRDTSAARGKSSAPVVLRMSSAARSSTSLRRAHMVTLAPGRAKRSAAARPMPSLPPVTIAILPLSPSSKVSMAPKDSTLLCGLERVMTDYWERKDLAETILAALAAAGKSLDALTVDDLAVTDQFHGGGKPSTLRLARLLDPGPGTRVLDVGGGLGGPAAARGVRVRRR